jgi:hypothetical protein
MDEEVSPFAGALGRRRLGLLCQTAISQEQEAERKERKSIKGSQIFGQTRFS